MYQDITTLKNFIFALYQLKSECNELSSGALALVDGVDVELDRQIKMAEQQLNGYKNHVESALNFLDNIKVKLDGYAFDFIELNDLLREAKDRKAELEPTKNQF